MSVERARLFVALELPREVCEALAGSVGARVGRTDGMRVLAAQSLHVTLCFLGTIAMGEVPALTAALDEVATGVGEPLVLGVSEVIALPRRRPRVHAIALRDADGRAAALQAALAARLADGGWYTPERRPWFAHVSVARVGRSGGGSPSGGPRSGGGPPSAPGPLAPPALDPFPATAVLLLRSWPGSRYEALHRIALPT